MRRHQLHAGSRSSRFVDPADPPAQRPELAERRQLGPVAEDQQPHRVEQDQQRADLVEDRRGDRAEDAQRRQEHRHGVEPEGEADDVLPDDPHRGPGQLDQGGKVAQRIAQEDQVARLGREVGADAPQRDPGVGLGQRRRVVDAVADHRHVPARLLLLLDPPAPCPPASSSACTRLDVDLLRDPPRHRLAIAGQDGELADLQVLQVVDHVVGLGRGPCRGARSRRRSPRRRPRGAGSLPGRRAASSIGSTVSSIDQPVLGQQPPVAHEDPGRRSVGPVDAGLDPAAGFAA